MKKAVFYFMLVVAWISGLVGFYFGMSKAGVIYFMKGAFGG